MPKSQIIKHPVRRLITADRASGAEGTAFAMSVLVRVVEVGNRRVKFKFPFWAFSVLSGSNHGTEWINNREYGLATTRILRFVQQSGGLAYFRDLRRQIIKEEHIFEQEAQRLRGRLGSFSDHDLAATYAKFMERYCHYYGLGIVTFLYENILSDRLMSALLVRSPRAADFLPHWLTSSYTSFMVESEQALAQIKQAKSLRRRQALSSKYQQDFFYIRSNYWHAPEPDQDFIRQQLGQLAQSRASEAKAKPPRHFKLEQWERATVDLLKISDAIHDKRKQINMIGSYMMFGFLAEAARRRKIKMSLAKRAFWFEYRELLLSSTKILPRLQKRTAFSAIYDHGRSLYFNYAALADNQAEIVGQPELRGTPASPGLYRGLVRRVLLKADFKKFKPGEVLVADMTRPEFLPVLKQAGAIITDEGGLTCHAAIVARELGTPCIVGTKHATRLLRDGDLVEVDAARGVINILKKSL
jgi:phosphohistidine swiveling domain-containing protein